MEIRERKNPKDMFGSLEPHDPNQMPVVDAPIKAKVIGRDQFSNDKWDYPMKPAFFNDDSDTDSDEDSSADELTMMTTCCFCFSTKNGTVAVGIISLIISFCISVGTCFTLINLDQFQNVLNKDYARYQELLQLNQTDPRFTLVDNIIGLDFIIENLKIILIVILVFYGIYTFSALFLTYGACTDLRSLLLPWIILEFVPFGIQLSGIVVMFVYGKDDPSLAEGGIYIIAGLLQIAGFVIHVYWWMCPVSHYQSLKESTEIEPLVPPSHTLYPSIPKY